MFDRVEDFAKKWPPNKKSIRVAGVAQTAGGHKISRNQIFEAGTTLASPGTPPPVPGCPYGYSRPLGTSWRWITGVRATREDFFVRK